MTEREIKTWQNRNRLLRLMVDRSMDHCHFAKTHFCRSGWDGANVVTTDVATKTWAVGLGTTSAGFDSGTNCLTKPCLTCSDG
jgi:hypothetical protein